MSTDSQSDEKKEKLIVRVLADAGRPQINWFEVHAVNGSFRFVKGSEAEYHSFSDAEKAGEEYVKVSLEHFEHPKNQDYK